MTWLSALYFTAAFLILFIGLLVYRNNSKNSLNNLFLSVCVITFVWQFFYALMLNNSFNHAILFAKIGHSAVPFIPIVTMYYTLCFLKISVKRIYIILTFLIGITSSLLVYLSSYHFTILVKHSWGLYPKGGILMMADFIFCTLFGLIIMSLCINDYIIKRRTHNDEEINKSKYFILSILMFVFAITDYFPKLGYPTLPIGNIFVIIFVILNAYAILRHRMFNITIAIRKGVIYSLLITIISLIYVSIIYLLEYSFRGVVGYKSIPVAIVIIASFTLILQPLKNRIQTIVDKYFFQGSIEQIKQENMRLLTELKRTERLKAVGTLAAGMAHEIKNPLTSIKVFTEYLPEKHTDKNFIYKFNKIVSGEVNKINRIVSQLLDFAKPKAPDIKDSNIQILLDEILDLFNNSLLKYRISVQKKYCSDCKFIPVDPMQIKQVFINIILNSIDAMKESGGLLNIVIKNQNDFLSVSIADTGCGIDQKNIPNLFDPFFTTKETGVGLGLSIVHSIIENHHGSIAINSQLGKGTEFVIRLPTT